MVGMPHDINIMTGTGGSTTTGIPVLTLVRTVIRTGIRGMAGITVDIMARMKKAIMIGTVVLITIRMTINGASHLGRR